MIDIEQPSIALNDSRVSAKYYMTKTHTVMPTFTLKQIFDLVTDFAQNGSYLDDRLIDVFGPDQRSFTPKKVTGKVNVVLNCHGSPGYLQIGEGIELKDTHLFNQWSGFVEKIWIIACKVALIKSKGSETDGNMFCSNIAKFAQCYVVAGTELQGYQKHRVYPPNKIDSFEGLILSYGPDGAAAWTHRYPSSWKSNRE